MPRRLRRKIDGLVANAHATLANANEEIDDTGAAARAYMAELAGAVMDLLEEGVNVSGTLRGKPFDLLGLRITPVDDEETD